MTMTFAENTQQNLLDVCIPLIEGAVDALFTLDATKLLDAVKKVVTTFLGSSKWEATGKAITA